MDESIFYRLDKINSYDCLFNFIIGARGDGKTFAVKEQAINDFLKKGWESVYIRRTDVALKEAIGKFFKDPNLLDKYPDYCFQVKGKEAQICNKDENGEPNGDWKTFIYFLYLSNSSSTKSVSYGMVHRIYFDEFLVSKLTKEHYLPDEVTSFLTLYETIARLRDVKVYFMANALSTINPYFMYFNLKVPKTANGIKRIKQDIVIEVIQDEAYKAVKRKTRFGQLIEGTDFARNNIENEFIEDTEEWIEKKSQKAYYECTIFVDNEGYGVYRDMSRDRLYISPDVDLNFPRQFQYNSVGKASMTFKSRRRYVIINDIVWNFEQGNVRFENQRVKDVFWKLFTKIM